jgi:hypothetical protein|tara:strand:- start:313 stop:447 length:135 start_codon:yes stop_codon:yes gene_type:complete
MNEGLATAPAPTLAGIFNHRDNLNASLPVDDQQEGQVADAGFNR